MRDVRRLAVISTHPIQYQVPLWRALAARGSIDLEVLYASRQGLEPYFDDGFGREVAWDVPLGEGYDWRVLDNRPIRSLGWRFAYRCPDVHDVIDRDRFDAVLLVGKENWFYQQAITRAQRAGVPVLYRADTPPPKATRLESAVAHVQRRRLFSRFAACLCISRSQFAFYRGYGVPASRLHWAPCCVDNDHFRRAARHYGGMRDTVRMRFGVDDERPVIAFAAKFVANKRPLDLLRAFEAMPTRDRCALVMAGSGPLLDSCRDWVRRRGLGNVSFPGFLNQGEIGALYAAADCFVLPSAHETWGLVVNEAMNFGLPIVTTDAVGAAEDLVTDGDNGFCYPVGDVDALAARLDAIVATDGVSARMGARSLARIRDYSIEKTVVGVEAALDAVTSAGRRVEREGVS